MTGTKAAVAGVIRDAQAVYHDDPQAVETLRMLGDRLQEPLRVAVAGMVKAGKSTLINAIIGEEIAPTGTGECTRIVTWYRYGDTPRVTMFPLEGEPRTLPVRRIEGQLDFDLHGVDADEVDRLVIDWPVSALRDMTIIDTPGIASVSSEVSARSMEFLVPETGPSAADAIVYVMRHLHEADLAFLEQFRRTTAGSSGIVNALAVLSRADEIGAGRIDSLLAARDIATRYRTDETLRSLAMGVVPVAGLLAQTARTLRQSEFAALTELAGLDRTKREKMLISADRFTRPDAPVTVSGEARADLLARFGLFGIRLSTVLIGSGITEPTPLAHELARRSGLGELRRLIAGQFQVRADHLTAHTAMVGLEHVLRERPRDGIDTLAMSLERIRAGEHEYRELRLLAEARTAGLGLPPADTAEAERLMGGEGVTDEERLGLDPGSPAEAIRAAAIVVLERWRYRAQDPMASRRTSAICQAVVRSCEGILARTASGQDATAQLVLSSEPGRGARQQAGDEAGAG